MDTGFDEDESELGVLVFAVAFEVFADGYCLYRHISLVSARGFEKADGRRGWTVEAWTYGEEMGMVRAFLMSM